MSDFSCGTRFRHIKTGVIYTIVSDNVYEANPGELIDNQEAYLVGWNLWHDGMLLHLEQEIPDKNHHFATSGEVDLLIPVEIRRHIEETNLFTRWFLYQNPGGKMFARPQHEFINGRFIQIE